MRYFPKPVSCAVEDQACAQVALSSRQHAPQHAVDTNASLFLSLNQLTIADLVRNPDGSTPLVTWRARQYNLHAANIAGIANAIGLSGDEVT